MSQLPKGEKMTSFCKHASFGQQKRVLMLIAVVLFVSILLSAVKQERKAAAYKKPFCLKGYMCQAAMKNTGR